MLDFDGINTGVVGYNSNRSVLLSILARDENLWWVSLFKFAQTFFFCCALIHFLCQHLPSFFRSGLLSVSSGHWDIWESDEDVLTYTLRFGNAVEDGRNVSEVDLDALWFDEYSYSPAAHWSIVYMCEPDGSLKAWIGLSITMADSGDRGVVDILMPPDAFFRLSLERVESYLADLEDAGELDAAIMAADISRITGEYSLTDVVSVPVCHKTFWISILKRRWRKKYAERKAKLLKRGGLLAQRHFELHGNYGGFA